MDENNFETGLNSTDDSEDMNQEEEAFQAIAPDGDDVPSENDNSTVTEEAQKEDDIITADDIDTDFMKKNEEHSYGGFSEKWTYENNEKKAKKKHSAEILATVMTILFIVTLAGFIIYYLGSNGKIKGIQKGRDENGLQSEETVGNVIDRVTRADGKAAGENADAVYTGENLSNGEIIALATPAIVGIKTEVQGYNMFYGSVTYTGVGSGFIITEDGYVVTNYHVIENAASVKVVLSEGDEYDATIIGSDSLADVAVLKIESNQKLPTAIIGNSDDVDPGDDVIAIGCPSGIELAGTATRGMVSAVKRKIDITDDYGNVKKTMTVIQIDAPINPGNSGGPLLNSRGEVIGINTIKLSQGYEGIGFALPINGVMDLVEQICNTGVVTDRGASSYVRGKAALGITYKEITEADAKRYRVPEGVLVVLLSQNGGAQQGGVKSGDIIVGFDDEEIKSADDLVGELKNYAPGDTVDVKVYRDGEYITLSVILGEAEE